MTATMHVHVDSVRLELAGDVVTTALSVGATQVPIGDAADFDELGRSLTIDGSAIYSYTMLDDGDDTGTEVVLPWLSVPAHTLFDVDFEQWMTVIAVSAGPAGIAFGWVLSEVSERRRAKETDRQRVRQAGATRAIAVLQTAATLEYSGRALANAAARSATAWQPDRGQLVDLLASYNAGTSELDRAIIESDVLGPPGLAAIGRTLQAHAQSLTGDLSALHEEVTQQRVDRASATLDEFEAALEQATEDVRTLLTESGPRA